MFLYTYLACEDLQRLGTQSMRDINSLALGGRVNRGVVASQPFMVRLHCPAEKASEGDMQAERTSRRLRMRPIHRL